MAGKPFRQDIEIGLQRIGSGPEQVENYCLSTFFCTDQWEICSDMINDHWPSYELFIVIFISASFNHIVMMSSYYHHIMATSFSIWWGAEINERCALVCPRPPPTMLHITPIVLNIVLHHTILIIILCPLKLFWCFNLLVCGVQAIVWLCTNTKKAFERYTQELLLSSAEKKLQLNLGILH